MDSWPAESVLGGSMSFRDCTTVLPPQAPLTVHGSDLQKHKMVVSAWGDDLGALATAFEDLRGTLLITTAHRHGIAAAATAFILTAVSLAGAAPATAAHNTGLAHAGAVYAATQTQDQVNAGVQQILKETNAARAAQGLKPLALETTLNSVAQSWSKQMSDDGFFEHRPFFWKLYPKGAERNYAENIARGVALSKVVSVWMDSPGHRANILNGSYTHIGIGYYVDEAGHPWYTQNFGSFPVVKAPQAIGHFDSYAVHTTGMTVEWGTMLDGVTDYKVDLYEGTALVASVVTPDPDYVFDGLKEDTAYTVKVTARAVDHVGKVYASPTTSHAVRTAAYTPHDPETGENIPVSAPVAPGMPEVDTFDNRMSWDAPASFEGQLNYYTVTLKQEGKTDRVFRTKYNYSFNLGDLSENTSYTVTVTANILAHDRNSTLTTPAATMSFTTPVNEFSVSVGAVGSLKTTAVGDTEATVTWAAPSGTVGTVPGYRLKLIQGGKTVKHVWATTNSYRLTGLTYGTPYKVVVIPRAASANQVMQVNGPEEGTAFTTTAVGVAKAGKIPSVQVSATTSTVAATWGRPAVTGKLVNYTVSLKQGTRTVGSYSTTGTKASFAKLQEGAVYRFHVTANVVSSNGKAKASSHASYDIRTKVTAASTVKVGKPAFGGTSATRSSITVTWKKPYVYGKVTSYTVLVKQGARTVKSYTVTSGRMTATGLRANTAYTVHVRANASSSNGKYKASSPYVVKTVATKR